MVLVKNGNCLLDHRTLKSAMSQENELIKWTDFFTSWYKFRKVNINSSWAGMAKNGLDHMGL